MGSAPSTPARSGGGAEPVSDPISHSMMSTGTLGARYERTVRVTTVGMFDIFLWRRPAGWLLMAATMLVGPLACPVAAQGPNQVELLVGGGGGATNSNWNGFSPPAIELGATFWWNDDWGISGRHEFHILPNSSVRPRRFYYDRRFSNVTLRRRWPLGDAYELDLGFGATLITGRGQPTGGAVPFEVLVGRSLSRHFGVKGGYRHEMYWGDIIVHRSRFIGFAVFGF